MAQAKVLSRDEVKRVMRMADCTKHGLRDRVTLALSIQAGMRIGEIAALKIGDVRGINGRSVEVIHLTKHQTKGNRSRRVFLGDDLRKLLNTYLAQIERLEDSRAFIRSIRTGGHFSNVSLSSRLKAIYESAGIKTSSHSGRRSFCTALHERGVGIKTIQHLMGHRSIQSTAIYVSITDDQMTKAVNAI
jgi:integrase/recombinase XerD